MDRQGTWEARFRPCKDQAGMGRPAISIQTPVRHRACTMPGALGAGTNTRVGYSPKALADRTDARLPEIRRFLKGKAGCRENR